MFDRLKRSWQLVRESWAVLKEDRSLALFPIFSGIASILVLATFAIPLALLTPWGEVFQRNNQGSRLNLDFSVLHYLGVFAYYLVNYFVVVFFNTGLVACVRKRFAGETPTVADGLSFALVHIGMIFQWAVVSATVGTVLQAVQERAGMFGRIVTSLIGLAWTLATTFVVPVLVYERVGPVEALKRSASLFRQTWGETVAATVGISTAFSLLSLGGLAILAVGIAAGVAAFSQGAAFGIAVFGFTALACVTYWVGLAIVQSALQGIFLTAAYEYATTGKVPSAFTHDLVAQAWRRK